MSNPGMQQRLRDAAGVHRDVAVRQLRGDQPAQLRQLKSEEVLGLVMKVTNPETRVDALALLAEHQNSIPDLALVIWHSMGCVAALLQEVIKIYPVIAYGDLTKPESDHVCCALTLLQACATHERTRHAFLAAQIPLFLYPFLNTNNQHKPYEYLRLTSLSVIGAMVKPDDPQMIQFLLQTEVIPLCLRIMEGSQALTRTVATFIMQRVLLDDMGLNYICATAERFYSVSTTLNKMVQKLPSVFIQEPGYLAKELKHIICCYLRLCDNPRAQEALRQCLPTSLRDGTWADVPELTADDRKRLEHLARIVGGAGAAAGQQD
eukprot:GHVU01033461.1.p1 GENE.GHVU01033461.1~~GHVU01033461.1.p1  ORF type:complete len:320 (-),score=54.52 GHVU01033461.1:441-1400(-)